MAGGGGARQKMINLMYLVFIAMMALNVDREVLRSFESIYLTLESSTKLAEDNNTTFYSNISKKAQEEPDYKAIEEKANVVRKEANEFFTYIEGLKTELKGTEYTPGAEETDYNLLANSEPVMQLFFKGEGGDKGNAKAQELVSKMENFRKFLLTYAIEEGDKKRINQVLSTEAAKGKKSWLLEKFYEQPMVAVMSNLTKLQADARTEEGNIVRDLLGNKLKEKIELNSFQGMFLSPGIVKVGDDATLNVVLGAFDNSITGNVQTSVGAANLVDGKASIKLNTGSVGIHQLTGKLTYKDASGATKTVDILPSTYQVVAQTLDVKAAEIIEKDPTGGSIVADNLRVVYRGVENPISATINGANGPVSMTASSGNLSGAGANRWNHMPGSGNEVVFTASAKASSGKTLTVRETFRVKPLPPARGVVMGKTHAGVPQASLASQRVRVDWPDFLFPVKGEVESFSIKVPGSPIERVNGNSLGGASSISKAKRGDNISIINIKYKSSLGQSGDASIVSIEVL
ncbi:MAG TPA: GldM family protein [Faecalibacter sp.]